MIVMLKSYQYTWQGVKAPHYIIDTKEAFGDQVEVVEVDLSDMRIEAEDFSGSIFT